jgi:group II intron reverse transcriptase/maturase
MANGGCWIVEADIRKFFDSLDHAHIREILRRRIRDGALLRLIHKWLKAGVFEKGQVSYPETGTPQGGVISPLLANAVLHVILDEWFVNVVQPRLHGPSFLIRFADDFVIGVHTERDAQNVFEALPKRFGRFDLQLHPEKSGLIDFRRPRIGEPKGSKDHEKRRTFEFLGFTWYWARTRRGGWAVKLQTASSRARRFLRGINLWCRSHRHLKVSEQHAILSSKLRGHYNYYGVIANWRCLQAVLYHARRHWRKWLNRRSQRARMRWKKYALLLERYPLPKVTIAQRYRVSRSEPMY